MIRSDGYYRLAPIYDLAPMVMDAEGVTRTTKWAGPIERLRALPDILRDSGLPDITFNHPAIALSKLDQRLSDWGLR